MPMKTRSKKKATQAKKSVARASPTRRPATPPETPLVLRGEDSDETTSAGFQRYITRRQLAAFQSKLYSDSDSSPPKRGMNAISDDIRVTQPSKKRRFNGGQNGHSNERGTFRATKVKEVVSDKTGGKNGDAVGKSALHDENNSIDVDPEYNEPQEEDPGDIGVKEVVDDGHETEESGDIDETLAEPHSSLPMENEEVVDEGHETDDELDAGGVGQSEGEQSEGGRNESGRSESEQSGGEQGGADGDGRSEDEHSGGEQSGGEQSGGEQTGGEQTGGEQTGGERSGGEHSGGEQTGGERSGGEQSSGERSARQDGVFPGEHYRPPRKVRFNRGRCVRTGSTSARVMIKYDVLTATKCPCEDRACTKLVNIGTWGILGGGSTVCVHCGFKRKGGWDGCGYGFMGKEDLVRHLNTAKCKAMRGVTVQKKSLKEILGEHVYHKINDPTYAFRKKDRDGNVKKFYKCFVCDRILGFRSRHSHHLNAKHGTDLNGGEDSE